LRQIFGLVHAGCVGIGILERDENSFVQEIPVGGSSSWREITLGIPSIAAAGPLEYYADRRRLGRGRWSEDNS
jgi:hypothetical protein